MAVCYPREFEVYRLEALGDPPYLSEEEARRAYLVGDPLSVVPAEPSATTKPAWFLFVSAQGTRFALTFYTDRGTPVREVKWEKRPDGDLVLRSTRDLFYPEGDPGRRVPFAQIVSVRREFSTDGVAVVVLQMPEPESATKHTTGVDAMRLAIEAPDFGHWDDLVASSAPERLERFGAGAVRAARAFAGAAPFPGQGTPAAPAGGWTIALTARQLVDRLGAVAAGADDGVVVFERGDARVVPLALQAPLTSDRDPAEEIRRMQTLARDIELALEPDNGLGILLDEGRAWTKAIETYLACLGDAGADQAKSWTLGRERAAVLVWSGDQETGTRALALHVVPAHWVSDRYDGKPERVDLRWDAASVQATKEKDA